MLHKNTRFGINFAIFCASVVFLIFFSLDFFSSSFGGGKVHISPLREMKRVRMSGGGFDDEKKRKKKTKKNDSTDNNTTGFVTSTVLNIYPVTSVEIGKPEKRRPGTTRRENAETSRRLRRRAREIHGFEHERRRKWEKLFYRIPRTWK